VVPAASGWEQCARPHGHKRKHQAGNWAGTRIPLISSRSIRRIVKRLHRARCPWCGGRVTGWGWDEPRTVYDGFGDTAGRDEVRWTLEPCGHRFAEVRRRTARSPRAWPAAVRITP
jgi:hypothetical protein